MAGTSQSGNKVRCFEGIPFFTTDGGKTIQCTLPANLISQVAPYPSSTAESHKRYYDQIQPILTKAGSTISLLEYNEEFNLKVIRIIGKKLFDALFDINEIMERLTSRKSEKTSTKIRYSIAYDDDKVCLIARSLSWLIGKPKFKSMDAFKAYEAEMMLANRTGLTEHEYTCFRTSILTNYGCIRKRAWIKEQNKK